MDFETTACIVALNKFQTTADCSPRHGLKKITSAFACICTITTACE